MNEFLVAIQAWWSANSTLAPLLVVSGIVAIAFAIAGGFAVQFSSRELED